MKFSVACPVCSERLEWEQSGDTSWGTIGISDLACATVTIQDPSGVVNAHLSQHREDGTWVEKWKTHQNAVAESIERMRERGVL